MKKIFLIILAFILFAPFVFAQESSGNPNALNDAYIKFRQVGWQTYEFNVLTNLANNDLLNFEWTVDSMETFNSPRLHYFFTSGEHNVRLKVEDKFGNVKYDKVKLNVEFWSLSNNWFWWLFYMLLVFILLYYWIAKIIYLLHRDHVNKEIRYFLDALDEYGWVNRVNMEREKRKQKELKKLDRLE